MWNKNLIVFLLFEFLFAYSCTFNDSNNVVIPPDKTVPSSPSPANGAINQENILTLSWQFAGADSFTVYFDTQNPPQKILRKNYTKNSTTAFAPGTTTKYYWKVIAKFKNGTNAEGPVWSFTTKSSTTASPGYLINGFGVTTYPPNIVRALFQVSDLSNKGVANLVSSDFEVYEDGKKISSHESLLNISKKESNYFAFNTVLMIDNSTSLTDDNGNNLSSIKTAAKDFVKNMFAQQNVAIYSFSGTTNLILDFTPVSDQAKIFSAIDGIQKGARSTDLYGAVIQGASRIKQFMNVDSIISGAMVLFTDGDDTQGSHTLEQALNSVNGKNVYTIGLGTDLNPEILSLIGKNGYYQIADIAQLSTTFSLIQQELTDLSNSFYWLEYQTPKRGNFNHLLQIVIINNPVNSMLEATFNSSKFSDPPDGIYFSYNDGTQILPTQNIPIKAGGSPVEIFATSYGGSSLPNYDWKSDSLLTISKLNSNGSHVKIYADSNAMNQSLIKVTIHDLVNNYSNSLNFIISKPKRNTHVGK
ncbi:MAG: hypothetical protein Fur0015_08290 [Ignavibacteriales bacterium]